MTLSNRLHILPEIIIGASESIYVFLSDDYPTDKLYHDENIFNLVDSRLDLKCIKCSKSDKANIHNVIGFELLQDTSWQLRSITGSSKFNFIIIDSVSAFVTPSPKNELNYTGTYIYGHDDPIDWLRIFFDQTWAKSISSIELLYENLHSIHDSVEESKIALSHKNKWDRIIEQLSKNPKDMYRLKPREFEELICELLIKEGMEAKLTQETHDGGKDIIVHSGDQFGSHLYFVECKKYSEKRPISVDLIRSLYGVIENERASGGLLVTTSYFSKDALKFHKNVKYRLDLKSYEGLCSWLNKHKIFR